MHHGAEAQHRSHRCVFPGFISFLPAAGFFFYLARRANFTTHVMTIPDGQSRLGRTGAGRPIEQFVFFLYLLAGFFVFLFSTSSLFPSRHAKRRSGILQQHHQDPMRETGERDRHTFHGDFLFLVLLFMTWAFLGKRKEAGGFLIGMELGALLCGFFVVLFVLKGRSLVGGNHGIGAEFACSPDWMPYLPTWLVYDVGYPMNLTSPTPRICVRMAGDSASGLCLLVLVKW